MHLGRIGQFRRGVERALVQLELAHRKYQGDDRAQKQERPFARAICRRRKRRRLVMPQSPMLGREAHAGDQRCSFLQVSRKQSSRFAQ